MMVTFLSPFPFKILKNININRSETVAEALRVGNAQKEGLWALRADVRGAAVPKECSLLTLFALLCHSLFIIYILIFCDGAF